MSGCGRIFSKRTSVKDQAVFTLEEIPGIVEGKLCAKLNCVDWHFSTDNSESLCTLKSSQTSGCDANEMKVITTVSTETAKILQKWMDLNYSDVSSRAYGTLCVCYPSGTLKYSLRISHIFPLCASFEDCSDDKGMVHVHMYISCGSFYLEERHESTTPLFVSDYAHSVLYRLNYKDHFTNKMVHEVFVSLEDAEFRRDEVSDTGSSISELLINSVELE